MPIGSTIQRTFWNVTTKRKKSVIRRGFFFICWITLHQLWFFRSAGNVTQQIKKRLTLTCGQNLNPEEAQSFVNHCSEKISKLQMATEDEGEKEARELLLAAIYQATQLTSLLNASLNLQTATSTSTVTMHSHSSHSNVADAQPQQQQPQPVVQEVSKPVKF